MSIFRGRFSADIGRNLGASENASLRLKLRHDFLQEEALRQKRLAAAATNRPEASSVPPISSADSLIVTATSPDQVRQPRKAFKRVLLKRFF